MKNSVAAHYDILIAEGNDPVHDPEPLKVYMDKWDGQKFIDKMKLDSTKSVLEIGVGTGRLAARVAPLCKIFCGVDVSPKTIERAGENLAGIQQVALICGDFLTCEFTQHFDVIYSSLTFMHIVEKQKAVRKVAGLLAPGGRFILSIDKNISDYLDMGTRKVKIYPDTPDATKTYIQAAGLTVLKQFETECAAIFVAQKK